MKQAYRAIADTVEFVYEEKRSTFTAYAHPASSRDEALAVVQTIRRKYPGASHYCWAYIIGDARRPQTAAFNDDGEPSGTAGRPMLNVMTHREAGDCVAVVVRLFGGVKLGAGGLVRAYGAAVSGAMDNARWRQVVPTVDLKIVAAFADEQKVRHLLQAHGAQSVQACYSEQVILSASVAQTQYEAIELGLATSTSGQAILSIESAD